MNYGSSERDHEGTWTITEETGIVLVLIPGGDFQQGAQSMDKSKPSYDSMALNEECDPFFRPLLSPSMRSFFPSTSSPRASGCAAGITTRACIKRLWPSGGWPST
jgi:hypothetical protein